MGKSISDLLSETVRKLTAPSEKPASALPTVDEDAQHEAATKVAAAAKGRKARAEQAQRKEAAVKLQSINRGNQARKGGKGASTGSDPMDRALRSLYERCDETELGVSAEELEEMLSADRELKGLLEAGGEGRYQKLLHELELGKWLATEGRVSYAALVKIVMMLPTAGAGDDSAAEAARVVAAAVREAEVRAEGDVSC